MTKRLVLFTDSLIGGGAQRQLVTLARELNANGYSVSVLTYSDKEQLASWLKEDGIPWSVVKKNGALDIIFIYKLFRYFRNHKTDLIISYLNTPNLWARVIGKLAGVKRIITSERNVDLDKSPFRLKLEKILCRLSEKVVVNAHAIKAMLVENGIPKNKIDVIYNGLNTDYFKPASTDAVSLFRQSHGIAETDVVFLLPGRMTPQKNHISVLRALVHADSIPENLKILFVGNEFFQTIKEELLDFSEKHNLSKHIIYAGPSNDMPLVYSACDCVILPSLWEGLPNAAIEAMACGKPVIASDVSDNKRILNILGENFIFSVDDDVVFLDQILSFYRLARSDKEALEGQLRENAKESFSLKTFSGSYTKIIENGG